MKKFFTLGLVILLFVVGFAINGIAQIAGDFQTKATGNWSDFNAWNIYNGSSWIAATTGQLPTGTASVFVQATHIITVDDAAAVCNDLNVNGATTSKVLFSSAASILNIKGNMNLFSTGHNCFSIWTPGAKIVFSGVSAQGFSNLSVNSVFENIEVNKSSGALTTSSNFRFSSFTLTAGNFTVGAGDEAQGSSGAATININGGIWTQLLSTTKINNSGTITSPIGNLHINGGSMILATSNVAGGFQFSTINISNAGNLTLNNFTGNISIATSMSVDATSTFNTALTGLALPPGVAFDGIVNYNQTGDQTVNAVPYSYLKLSGTGVKTLEAGVTTIAANGTLDMSGDATAPTLISGGALSVSSTATNLIYSSTGSQTATANEWSASFQNVVINNIAGVSMAGLTRTIPGSLSLTNGIFNISAGGGLTLDGALLNRTNGFIAGTSTSDLTVTGIAGGTVSLPLSGNISLRNVTISGTRTLVMNGSNNMDLHGIFYIGSTATYDNGGESEILQGGGGSIVIDGKFINRDEDNFSGTNGAIPGIIPALNSGCTIEYALAGDQVVTARSDYQNIIFSGSGIKTPSSAFTPTGTLTITGSAILDATASNIGDGVAGISNFTMDGGKLILGTTGTQPMMNGIYNLSGGLIQFTNAGATPQTIRSPETYYAIEVTGSNVGNSLGDINLASGGSFTVKAGGRFVINADQITGASGPQIVSVEAGAEFQCGSADGFSGGNGSIGNSTSLKSDIETISLAAGSTVNYMRSGIQTITNQLAYQNLAISGSGNKTAPAGTLTIQGDLTKSGTSLFLHNGGSVLLNGTTSQSFAGMIYNSLILSGNTKTTSGTSTIIDSIKINAGTILSISASDAITLHSDAIRTARMAMLDGSINYNTTGKFVVERYISAKPAWRFLSVATVSAQTIKQAWQEGALNSTSDPVPGFGTQITSNRASWVADGFDVFSAGGPSMKTYNPATDNYTGITGTIFSFASGLGGYMTFVRGNRTAITFGSPVSSTVLRTMGSLITGTQPDINLVSGEIIPVNNPYASSLDLRKVSESSNVFYYVWDPNRGGAFGLGAFQTLSWNGTDYDVVPGNSGSYGTINDFIESGQAFFASTLGADTALKLNENAKSSTTFTISPFKVLGVPAQRLRTNLYIVNQDETTLPADGVLNDFGDTYNDDVDGLDAKKIANFSENLSIKIKDQLLVVERRHTIISQDTIFLNLTGVKARQYRFEFIADNLDRTGLTAFIEDNYIHAKMSINLNSRTLVDFSVVNDTGSYAPGRFRIVFVPAVALPVTFTSVKAYSRDKRINVEWRVENEMNIEHYEIEKSINGSFFAGFAIVPATGNNGSSVAYLLTDTSPVEGGNYYRIKSIDKTGNARYSTVVKVFIGTLKNDIVVYPNPVRNEILRLQFNNQPAGNYAIRLIDKSGRVIASTQIYHAGSGRAAVIRWGYSPSHGMYQLEVTKPGGRIKAINVMY